MESLKRHAPFGKFPLLVDDGTTVIESTAIIEYLAGHHPGPIRWIPDGEAGLSARFPRPLLRPLCHGEYAARWLDAFAQKDARDPYGVEQGCETTCSIAYDWLEANLGDGLGCRRQFTLADCAAAPSLFYADWVQEIGPSGRSSRLIGPAAGAPGRGAGGR